MPFAEFFKPLADRPLNTAPNICKLFPCKDEVLMKTGGRLVGSTIDIAACT